MKLAFLMKLTGLLLVVLLPLRTKVNVDHAGLSLPLLLLRVLISLKLENFSHLLSNNLLTATLPLTDVVVDGNPTLSSMPRSTLKNLSLNIHTRLLLELAKIPKLPDMLMLKLIIPSLQDVFTN
jgi:hypothetical protein